MTTRRPRVALDLTTLLTTGGLHGIGRYAMELMEGLAPLRARAGVKLEAVGALDEGGKLVVSEDLVGLGQELLAAPSRGIWIAWFRRLHFMARLERAGFDLVHLPEPLGTPLHGRLPRVTTCHDLYPLRHPRHLDLGYAEVPLRYLREQRRFREARRVIAISPQTRRDLRRWLRIPARRIDVVPNGIDLSRFSPEPGEPFEGLPDRPFVLFVGSWGDPRKRVVDLLDALARAREKVDLHLVIAGKTSDRRARPVLEHLERRNLSRVVHRLGFVPDEALPSLYRRATALALLSAEEGFGYPVVEALACGCPVIVREGSGADRFCEAGGGVVARRTDVVAEAAAAMVRLTSDADFRANLAAQGPEAALPYGRAAMGKGHLLSFERAAGVR